MKRFLIVLLTVILMIAAVGCGSSSREPESVAAPETAEPIPDGLSGAPFTLGDYTYAFWRILRYPSDGGTTKYEIQVLQTEGTVPVTFTTDESGATVSKCLVNMKMEYPTDTVQVASGINIFQTDEMPGYAIVMGYDFSISDGDSLPETAMIALYDGETGLITQGKTLYLDDAITIDAEEDQSAETGEESASIPEELVGTWKGSGEPESGGSSIALDIVINADATGIYTFEQAGYVESYSFTLANDDDSFSVSIPADNQLGISACGGTYSYSDGTLTLNITTEFSSGRQYRYVAKCTKAAD